MQPRKEIYPCLCKADIKVKTTKKNLIKLFYLKTHVMWKQQRRYM